MSGTDTGNCTEVTPECPVHDSIYGYRPTLSVYIVAMAVFLVCLFVNLFFGIRYRTWTYLLGLACGCFLEAAGDVGEIKLHNNPYDSTGFKLQIICLTIAPAFVSAGVYLNLKHLVLTYGKKFSLLRPQLYTYIFIFCDVLSIVLQGIGGSMAAANTDDPDKLDTSRDILMGGLVFQIITLFIFGVLSALFFARALKHKNELNVESEALRAARRFQLFQIAMWLAYFCILVRCCYRAVEFHDGWGSSVMRNETYVIVMDTIMMIIAVIALTVFHPGFCFTVPKSMRHDHGSSDRAWKSKIKMRNMRSENDADMRNDTSEV